MKSNRGGNRGGAGRPRKMLDLGSSDDPLDLLRAIMRCEQADITLRIRAAQALLRYGGEDERPTPAPGKKDRKLERAREVSKGRFAPTSTQPAVVPLVPLKKQ